MTTEDQITFSLRYLCRFDEGVQAWVGFIPRLQLYSQAPTKEDLAEAIRTTALRFLITCADIGNLGEVMHQCKMRRMSSAEIERHKSNPDSEYVQYYQCETVESVDVTLDIDALATIGALAVA